MKNVNAPWLPQIEANWEGMVAMIEVKISIDMPLPTPRSVMSSPNHMIIAVPAVMVRTMTRTTQIPWLGMICSLQPWNKVPGLRARDKIAVDCRIARPIVT